MVTKTLGYYSSIGETSQCVADIKTLQMLGSTWRRSPTKKVGSDLELVIPESSERVTSAVTAKKSDQLRSKTLSTEVFPPSGGERFVEGSSVNC